MLAPALRRRVERVLQRAQERGALGPAPVDDHVRHAEAMARVVGDPPRRCCDLGSGGGVPALVMALLWPTTRFALVEAMAKRARWLEQACRELDLGDRCLIVQERAEAIARDPTLAEQFDLVTARAFGAPAVVAECGAPLLRVGGRLVVSEPPERAPSRWPADGLERLGLGPAVWWSDNEEAAFVVIEKIDRTPERFPRAIGVPQKRPLW